MTRDQLEERRLVGEPSRGWRLQTRWTFMGAVAVMLVWVVAYGSWWSAKKGPGVAWRFLAVRAGLADLTAPETIPLPGGVFVMGSTEGEEDEQPPHSVEVPAFAIGAHEVTFDDWDVCVLAGGCGGHRTSDEGWGRGRRPVLNVDWVDVHAYVAWLNEVTSDTYRLPTEAEWEYAARAGTTTRYSWGNNEPTPEQANFGGNVGRTTEVGSYPPNLWGLYDMHGNVWEWVEDCWNESYESAPSDGSAWKAGECDRRVLRGGSWLNEPVNLRSASRVRAHYSSRDYITGFRIARALTQSENVLAPSGPQERAHALAITGR